MYTGALRDHTTASATVARELHATAAMGLHFVDAPVSGIVARKNGALTVMYGGRGSSLRPPLSAWRFQKKPSPTWAE
jgi:3-hydroxyisobutyrate dehydrogenase-like beta-hydroxyacid dehydrogenase